MGKLHVVAQLIFLGTCAAHWFGNQSISDFIILHPRLQILQDF